MKDHLPPGITIVKSENLEEWQMDIKVLDSNPLYQNETYRLKFTFSNKYPIGNLPLTTTSHIRFNLLYKEENELTRFILFVSIEPPEVQFIECPPTSDHPRPIPVHPHIYSNGIICLDLLSSAGWSPVQTVESVCMSIQSMLTANSRNERPPGDSEFVSYNRRRPRDINFHYDDDNV